jgi:hypothetical protein
MPYELAIAAKRDRLGRHLLGRNIAVAMKGHERVMPQSHTDEPP